MHPTDKNIKKMMLKGSEMPQNVLHVSPIIKTKRISP